MEPDHSMERLFGIASPPEHLLRFMQSVREPGTLVASVPDSDIRPLAYLTPAVESGKPVLVIVPEEAVVRESRFLQTQQSPGIMRLPDGDVKQGDVAGRLADGTVRVAVAPVTLLQQPEWMDGLRLCPFTKAVLDHYERLACPETLRAPDWLIAGMADIPELLILCDTPDPLVRDAARSDFHRQLVREYVQGWEPENVRLRVLREGDPYDNLTELLGTIEGNAVIYTRGDTTLLTERLRAAGFTAGQADSPDDLDAWRRGERSVLVLSTGGKLTGPGPKIRAVIHDGSPDALVQLRDHIATPYRDHTPLTAAVVCHPDERYHFDRRLKEHYPPEDHLALIAALLEGNPEAAEETVLAQIGARLPVTDVRAAWTCWQTLAQTGAVAAGEIPRMIGEARRIVMERRDAVEDYLLTTACRRRAMLDWFGQTDPPGDCGVCDNCRERVTGLLARKYDRRQLETLLHCIAETREKFGRSTITGVLRGRNNSTIQRYGLHRAETWGACAEISPAMIDGLIKSCISDGLLDNRRGTYPTLALTDIGRKVVSGRTVRELRLPKQTDQTVTDYDPALYEALRKVRTTLAKQHRVPTFVVAPDAMLQQIARMKPETPEALLKVKGVGAETSERFGRQFVEAVLRWRDSQMALGKGDLEF